MTNYDSSIIEPKWQRVWEEQNLYHTPDPSAKKPKKYILDMYPYPSGAVLHVGHMEGYVATDIVSRYLRMTGSSVLHPMGWDAFGLPAENYAIQTGIPPDKSTHDNINTFRRQLKMLGLSYDWSREIDTSDPNYYKWTQWLFIQLFKMGLAYKKKAPANWCPKDETVLANEQVINGKCERCGTEVIQKDLDQWFFKITAYADQLIDGLEQINWPKSTRLMQKNWIGRKEGEFIKFGEIEVFTTRPDTIFGATFVVLSPNHALAGKIKSVINPATGQEIPVFVDEYVLDEVGTGAIMGVPAYDDRDRVFAEEKKLPVVKAPLTEKSFGKKGVTYHLRDWLVSRQRYWGAPIPMIYCEKCGWQPVPDSSLPILLPTDVDFRPTGASPISRSKTFQSGVICPNCGGQARREVDTMDTFVDSSWYFLRFLDPKNNLEYVNQSAVEKWMPVDIYVGGGHTVQHLLFARFFQKALIDAGLLPKTMPEPFLLLEVPGWILGPDNRKMSKRWNNVITPDDVIREFGADTMRIYEMFMAPFSIDKPWNTNSVAGVHRFVNRLFTQFQKDLAANISSTDHKLASRLSITVNKVSEDIPKFHFNTAIAAMMAFLNEWEKSAGLAKPELEIILKILAPFAPHLAEELWNQLGKTSSIHLESWPTPTNVGASEVRSQTIIVTVNGKPRGTIDTRTVRGEVITEEEAVRIAKSVDNVVKFIAGKKVKKAIYVPGKIVNLVI